MEWARGKEQWIGESKSSWTTKKCQTWRSLTMLRTSCYETKELTPPTWERTALRVKLMIFQALRLSFQTTIKTKRKTQVSLSACTNLDQDLNLSWLRSWRVSAEATLCITPTRRGQLLRSVSKLTASRATANSKKNVKKSKRKTLNANRKSYRKLRKRSSVLKMRLQKSTKTRMQEPATRWLRRFNSSRRKALVRSLLRADLIVRSLPRKKRESKKLWRKISRNC